MPSHAPLADLLASLAATLDALGVRWYVFGAQAVLHWGRPRFTEDVDVTVLLGRVEANQLVEGLERAGFALRPEGTPAFVARTRVLPMSFGQDGWAVDIVLGGPGLEEAFQQRAVLVEVAPGVSIPVISAEDLVATKVLAGRAKDLDDVRSVIVAQADRLDRDAVRRLLTDLEHALGVSDLLPVFERLLGSDDAG